MVRLVRATAFALGLALAAHSTFAVEYHDYFVGFSTEFSVSSDLSVTPLVPDSLTVEALSFAGTYGPAALRPLRFRAGLGWFPGRPFRVFTGVELPLYEVLNRSKARAFGIYLISDVGLTIPFGWTAHASLAVLVPTSALGGIRIAAGVDRKLDALVTISMATGAYPIRSRRQGMSTL